MGDDRASDRLTGAVLRADADAPSRVFGGGFEGGFVDGKETWTPVVWGARYGNLSGAAGLAPYLYGGSGVQARIAELAAELSAAADDLWSFTRYETSIQGLQELATLLKTPFMIQIVTQILPTLSRSAS